MANVPLGTVLYANTSQTTKIHGTATAVGNLGVTFRELNSSIWIWFFLFLTQDVTQLLSVGYAQVWFFSGPLYT